jgi:hypothetical protein
MDTYRRAINMPPTKASITDLAAQCSRLLSEAENIPENFTSEVEIRALVLVLEKLAPKQNTNLRARLNKLKISAASARTAKKDLRERLQQIAKKYPNFVSAIMETEEALISEDDITAAVRATSSTLGERIGTRRAPDGASTQNPIPPPPPKTPKRP